VHRRATQQSSLLDHRNTPVPTRWQLRFPDARHRVVGPCAPFNDRNIEHVTQHRKLEAYRVRRHQTFGLRSDRFQSHVPVSCDVDRRDLTDGYFPEERTCDRPSAISLLFRPSLEHGDALDVRAKGFRNCRASRDWRTAQTGSDPIGFRRLRMVPRCRARHTDTSVADNAAAGRGSKRLHKFGGQ